MRLLSALVVLSALLTGCAGQGVDGTWVLVSRDLPDGSVQTPPDVIGAMTYANGIRNFNVYWKDEQGNPVSLSSISEYTLTDTEYIETSLYYQATGMDDVEQYDLSRETGVALVERYDGCLEFTLPLHDEPHVIFMGHRFTATREGVFVDHWERID